MGGPADVYTVPKHASTNTNDVILPHEENYDITLRCMMMNKQI